MTDIHMLRLSDNTPVYIEIPRMKIIDNNIYTDFQKILSEAINSNAITNITYDKNNAVFIFNINDKSYVTPELEGYEYDKSYINLIVLDNKIKAFFPLGYKK